MARFGDLENRRPRRKAIIPLIVLGPAPPDEWPYPDPAIATEKSRSVTGFNALFNQS
jgi:hypothetical protein